MIVPDADLKFARNALIFFTQNAALARAVKATQQSPLMWRLMQGNALDAWVLNWCVLFGSDNSNNQPLHWKNMFEPNAFRAGLHAALSIKPDEWVAYRNEVVDYRNELAAHRDLNPSTVRYPFCDIALEAAAYYADQLMPRLVERGIDPIVLVDLQDHFRICLERFGEQAAECMSDWKMREQH